MVLPPGVDIDEFMPEGREVVVVENILDPPRDEGEEELSAEKVDRFSWEESCLLRFSKFLGMSPEGYEDDVLDLMYKISDRRKEGKGKEVQGKTKFDREMKKQGWIMQENGRASRGVAGKGTRAIMWKY